MDNYIVKDHDNVLVDIQNLDNILNEVINEFLKNFGAVLSVGGTVAGVIMAAAGTNAVRVGAVEILTYTTGAVVGWTMAVGMGLVGIVVLPIYGHMKYDDEAK
jgi:hypothetical protein